MEINNGQIQQIHDNVFEFLLNWYFENNFNNVDSYFRTRLRYTQGKETFWFLGNSQYVAIPFWTGNDFVNKTPNIYIEIRPEGFFGLYIVGRDNENKFKLLNELSNKIDGLISINDGLWQKVYTENHEGDYLKNLDSFLKGDKIIIDEFLKQNLLQITDYKDINVSVPDDDLEYTESSTRQLTKEEFYNMLTVVIYRKYRTEDYFFKKEINEIANSIMPICIKSLEVRNFHGIKYFKIDSIPVDSKWIVLTGENGYGKSSVLQSIAIGLYGNMDGSYQLLDDKAFVFLEAKRNNENFINLSFNYNLKNFNPINKELAVYGASRLNIANDSFRPNSSPGNVTYNLFFPNGTMINVENELKESFAYNLNRFNMLKEAFCKLIPDLYDIKVESKDNSKPVVKYVEKDSEGNPYQEITFDQLASGFRNIIAMVGDIVSRLTLEQHDLTSLDNLRGIVIIDEIELHLHPKYQKLLPKTLSEIFPNILFIVSTHSPIPLLGMPKETTLLKINRSMEKGITVERLDVDFTNLLPNAILTSPVFGFQNILPTGHDGEKIISVADSYKELKDNEKIEQKIGEFLSAEKTQEFLEMIKK